MENGGARERYVPDLHVVPAVQFRIMTFLHKKK
jgi:hypothetical protein